MTRIHAIEDESSGRGLCLTVRRPQLFICTAIRSFLIKQSGTAHSSLVLAELGTRKLGKNPERCKTFLEGCQPACNSPSKPG
jgi:hypothetical protein